MRYLAVLSLVLALLVGSSCHNIVKSPQFVAMQNLKFGGLTTNGATLKAEAVFNNPNRIGVQLTQTNLDVLVNQKNAAHVTQAYQVKVPAHSDFKVPVDINITPAQLMADGWGFITGKKIKVRYKGSVTIRALRRNFNVPVDYEQEVDMSMFK